MRVCPARTASMPNPRRKTLLSEPIRVLSLYSDLLRNSSSFVPCLRAVKLRYELIFEAALFGGLASRVSQLFFTFNFNPNFKTPIMNFSHSLSPIPMDRSISAENLWQPFPVDVFRDKTGSFIQETAGAIGIDPAFIAPPVLSALSGLLGRTCRIELKRGYSEIPSIWTLTLASDGTIFNHLSATLADYVDRKRSLRTDRTGI